MMNSGKLDLSGIQFFILDEADRLLDGENTDMIMRMYRAVPKGGPGRRLQVLLFSATLHSPEITTMSQQITHNAIWVDLKGKDAIPDVRSQDSLCSRVNASFVCILAIESNFFSCLSLRRSITRRSLWTRMPTCVGVMHRQMAYMHATVFDRGWTNQRRGVKASRSSSCRRCVGVGVCFRCRHLKFSETSLFALIFRCSKC